MKTEEELKGRQIFEDGVRRFEEDLTSNMSSLLSSGLSVEARALVGRIMLEEFINICEDSIKILRKDDVNDKT
tara:strand:- start:693 stop:911 length:219 start_codon:yes stop_codon:yes gene_type:complete